jgi:hypothetical protein
VRTPIRFMRPALVAVVLLLCAGPAQAKLTPQQKCQAGKNQAAGKYAACRESAAAKFVQNGDTVKRDKNLATCVTKFTTTWGKLEAAAAKAGASCLDDASTAGDFQAVVDQCTDAIVTGLTGSALPDCPIQLATCESDLAACQAGGGTLLETGETLCYDATNMPTSCTGTGQDGELLKGLTRGYQDNADGTVTDTRTGLTWEKLSDDDSVNDKDNIYSWSEAFGKITLLNTNPCFAGHCDWRLPNVNELHSLLDYGKSSPMVDTKFNTGCAPTCAPTACSCIDTGAAYWTSTTVTGFTDNAWQIPFDTGYVVVDVKTSPVHVRAVRGGA